MSELKRKLEHQAQIDGIEREISNYRGASSNSQFRDYNLDKADKLQKKLTEVIAVELLRRTQNVEA